MKRVFIKDYDDDIVKILVIENFCHFEDFLAEVSKKLNKTYIKKYTTVILQRNDLNIIIDNLEEMQNNDYLILLYKTNISEIRKQLKKKFNNNLSFNTLLSSF